MRLRFLGAAIVAALGVILMPGAALSVANIQENDSADVADFDSRVGMIAPSRAPNEMPALARASAASAAARAVSA